MDIKEAKEKLIIATLQRYDCISSSEISNAIKRNWKVDLSPSAVSGVLRGLTKQGRVGSSNCGAGKTVYWITNANWKSIK